jgi:hypothetical protein
MVELRRRGEIIDDMDGLWDQLLAGAKPDQRTLSFNLYQAALAVALHGCEEVSGQLAARAATWRAARSKRNADETKRFRTAHAVEHSSKPKGRATVGENAYEEVAKREGISPVTAEKRRYRKPRR